MTSSSIMSNEHFISEIVCTLDADDAHRKTDIEMAGDCIGLSDTNMAFLLEVV